MAWQLAIVAGNDELPRPPARGSSLSTQIVDAVREALFDKRLKPGDFLGTEKELAARYGVSRIVARDALRTLEALGVVDIRMGAGGGARIARGNPQRFAEALAIQLELSGTGTQDVMDAQRAIETMAAELAAERATPAEIKRLRALIADAERKTDDFDAFTRVSRDFHVAVAEASQNQVLVAQLLSLQHVSWPSRNRTLTRAVAEHVLAVHRKLVDLIEARDGAAARRLMDEHVQMIRARRVAERGAGTEGREACC